MGFTLETSISALTVFAQGLLSFFSPCVLPLVPLYLGYLAGGATSKDLSDRQRRNITLRNTLFFIVGISFAFFLLGLGFTSIGRFLNDNRAMVSRIGGILIVLMGLVQVGFLSSKFMTRELRLPFNLQKWGMNPISALVMGFTFSFAWTPCVGPALTSVLLMAGSASTRTQGLFLIGVYTLGFVLPFLAVGLFTSQVLNFFKSHTNWLRWTAKAGGVLLIVMGVMMFTGWMNGFTGYLSGIGADSGSSSSQTQPAPSPSPSPAPTAVPENSASSNNASDSTPPESAPSDELPDAPDFTLMDQDGNTHTLSDYKGKVVFLNFWASWCGPCKMEMPDIQKLYQDMGFNAEDVVVLGVANPKNKDYPRNADRKTSEELKQFLADGGFTYPTVMDETGEVFNAYGITAFPTTFMIDADGKLFGYVSGAITRPIMDSIIQQTQTGIRQ